MNTAVSSCQVVTVHAAAGRVAVLDACVIDRMEATQFMARRGVMGIQAAVGAGKMLLQQGVRGASRTRPLGVRVAAAAFAATFRARGAERAQPQVCVVREATVRAPAGREAQAGVGTRY